MCRYYSRLANKLAIIGLAGNLTACGTIGDMGSIKEASELAVDCQPDKAIAALDRARQQGGLSGYMAMLEKVVVLRDAERDGAAESALEEYLALPEVDPGDRADTEESIDESLRELRKLREERTGRATCPNTLG